MIRLLLRLLRITDFEVCASCETLKQQLSFAQAEKKELTEVLLGIIKPKVYEAPAAELNPVMQTSALFSRRRAALESKDREEAKILRSSTVLGKPDDRLATLENELGIEKEGII